jgi:galactokinase
MPAPDDGLAAFLDAVAASGTFDDAPVAVSRAPGRLDVMGGIADYSGSLVLQMPIAEATFAAVQVGSSGEIRAMSLGGEAAERTPAVTVPVDFLFSAADRKSPKPLGELHDCFASQGRSQWAAYVIGVLGVLAHEVETGAAIRELGGCTILVDSSVPEGKGVSSSAAVEVATMMAVLGAIGATITPGERIAQLCQRVENFVVGAPCGIMDQMASALGQPSKLLSLLCQPHTVGPPVAIPGHIKLWGLDSGVRHSVGGCDYGTVRCTTFMARAILRRALAARKQRAASAAPASSATALALPDQCTELEHLVSLSPSLLTELTACLPEQIDGEAFITRYGTHDDGATTVDPHKTYTRIPLCAAHPVAEHSRVCTFRLLLEASASSAAAAKQEQMSALGELMYQSHASYTAIGLGSEATETIVRLVRSAGPASGLFGAKITGGGSGGTVCILGENTDAAEASFRKVVAVYRQISGHEPHVFTGSSLGAVAFGHRMCSPTKGRSQLAIATTAQKNGWRDDGGESQAAGAYSPRDRPSSGRRHYKPAESWGGPC